MSVATLTEVEFYGRLTTMTPVTLPARESGWEQPVGELGLDSLAVAELAAFLISELEVESLGADLDRRDWRAVTPATLYAEYLAAAPRH
jgi:hypothetical protein